MDIIELTDKVLSNNTKIRLLQEENEKEIFEYANSLFIDGERVIYKNDESYIDGKEFEISLQTHLNANIVLNSIWGTMIYIDCMPVKKDGTVGIYGMKNFPAIYLSKKNKETKL